MGVHQIELKFSIPVIIDSYQKSLQALHYNYQKALRVSRDNENAMKEHFYPSKLKQTLKYFEDVNIMLALTWVLADKVITNHL